MSISIFEIEPTTQTKENTMKTKIPYSNLLVLSAALSSQIAYAQTSYANSTLKVNSPIELNQSTQEQNETTLISTQKIRFKDLYDDEYKVGKLKMILTEGHINIEYLNQIRTEMWGHSVLMQDSGYGTYSFMSENIALDLINKTNEEKEYQILNCESTYSTCELAKNRLVMNQYQIIVFVAEELQIEEFDEKTQAWQKTDRIILTKVNE